MLLDGMSVEARAARSRCPANRAPRRGTSRRGAARRWRRGRSRARRAGRGTAGTSSHEGTSPVHGVALTVPSVKTQARNSRRVELGVRSVDVEGAQVLHRRGDPLDEHAVVAGSQAGHHRHGRRRLLAQPRAAVLPGARGAAVVARVEVARPGRRRGPSSRSRAANPAGTLKSSNQMHAVGGVHRVGVAERDVADERHVARVAALAVRDDPALLVLLVRDARDGR